MKRKLIAVLAGVLVLSALATSAYATPPTEVAGDLEYVAHIESMRTAGDNTFFTTTEDVEWRENPETGGFVGTATDTCVVVIHASGAWYYRAIGSFEGTVQGQTGTLEVLMVGSKEADTDWQGTWRILSGEGGLANLHGQGTWWGAGAPGPEVVGYIDYAGTVHFDP